MDADDPLRPPGDGTVDAGPDSGAAVGEVRWKMRRGDGSEWTVTDLSLAPDGLRVSGYRYVRDRRAPAESRREVLDDELLRTDDRVWCLDRRGAVVWRLTSPEGGDGGGDEADAGDVWPGGSFGGATGPGDDAERPADRDGAPPPAGGGPIGG